MLEKFFIKHKIPFLSIENTEFKKIIRIEKLPKSILKLNGIHKLIRVSPFGKNGKIHTSFCKINIAPIHQKNHIEILDKDIRIDFFKSSGPGGQHKNKTMSAVRLVHLPTNTIVTSSSERSQNDNKKYAYEQLQEKLNNKEKDSEFENKKSQHIERLNDATLTGIYNLHKQIFSFIPNNVKLNQPEKILNGMLELIM